MNRALTVDDQRLKVATRALQKAAGGLEASASITGTGKSQHGNYQSVDAEDFIPLDRIAMLEAVTHGSPAHPQVTRLLCELAGGMFLSLGPIATSDHPLALGFVRMVSEFGDTARETEAALSDGVIDPEEARRVRFEAEQVMEALVAFVRLLDVIIRGSEEEAG